jgi:hypothetical protein
MTIYAVAVSASDLVRARAFYELLGFRFPDTGRTPRTWRPRTTPVSG